MSQFAELLLNAEELKDIRHRAMRCTLPLYIVGGILGGAGAMLMGSSVVTTAFQGTVQSMDRVGYDPASYREGSPVPVSKDPILVGGTALFAAGMIFAGAEYWRFRHEDVVARQMLNDVNPAIF